MRESLEINVKITTWHPVQCTSVGARAIAYRKKVGHGQNAFMKDGAVRGSQKERERDRREGPRNQEDEERRANANAKNENINVDFASGRKVDVSACEVGCGDEGVGRSLESGETT